MSTGEENLRATLRQRARAARFALSAEERATAGDKICAEVQALSVFARAQRIAAYFAVASEVSVAALMAHAWQRSRSIYLPRLGLDHSMHFAIWSGDPAEIVLNAFGIGEPDHTAQDIDTSRLDVILLPLVAFDRRGFRLGSGAGYYDRALAPRLQHAAPPCLIGIAHSCQEVPTIPQAAWDVPLDLIATEREVIRITPAQG